MAVQFAEGARSLVGCRFRPQGRDPQTGLDCLGLVIAAFSLPDDVARRDYLLRGNHLGELQEGLLKFFRRVPRKSIRAGDVMVTSVTAEQIHLAVRSASGFIHADARLGKVVETPGEPPWPLVAVYRRRLRRRTRTR